jgi:hypothetical protein
MMLRSVAVDFPVIGFQRRATLIMDVIAALQAEATKLKKQLDTVLHAMHLLGGDKGKHKTKSKTVPIQRRGMSAAGKASIAAAQKKRWAKVRAAKKKAA